MPIKYNPVTRTFDFDTPGEAMDWYKLLRDAEGGEEESKPDQNKPAVAKSPVVKRPKPTASSEHATSGIHATEGGKGLFPEHAPSQASKILSFLHALNRNGRRVVKVLAEAFPSLIWTGTLASRCDLNAGQLGPIFRHIRTVAARVGLDPKKIIIRKDGVDEGKAQSSYSIAEEIATAEKKEVKIGS